MFYKHRYFTEFEDNQTEVIKISPKINGFSVNVFENPVSKSFLLSLLKNYVDNEENFLDHELVEKLLNNGIDVNYKDENDENALFYVIKYLKFLKK